MRIALMGLALLASGAIANAETDAQIKHDIIRASLASYPGPCPCPYNVDRAGHRCGRRSAYTRPGGYAPICYESDVTRQMIRDYRAAHPDK